MLHTCKLGKWQPRDNGYMEEAWRLDSLSPAPQPQPHEYGPFFVLEPHGPASYQCLPSLASSMTFVKFLNVSVVPLQQLPNTVVAPTTMCPTELTCKELHGKLKPLVLWWPDLLLRVAVLFPAFSWVVDTGPTLPFSLCSHIWIWVGTSGSE